MAYVPGLFTSEKLPMEPQDFTQGAGYDASAGCFGLSRQALEIVREKGSRGV